MRREFRSEHHLPRKAVFGETECIKFIQAQPYVKWMKKAFKNIQSTWPRYSNLKYSKYSLDIYSSWTRKRNTKRRRCVKRLHSMLFLLSNFEYRRNDMPRKAHRKQEPTKCRHRRPISAAESDAIFYF